MPESAFNLVHWKRMRQECRTDLWRLCRVLGYKDVGSPHFRIYNHLQKFKGGSEPLDYVSVKTGAGYEPACSMWELKGPRKKLTLVTRGGLKSSILTAAHKIQLILNYPDVRILLGSAKMERAKDFLKSIKNPFLKNDLFRWLFPEYCPKFSDAGKIEDFGDGEQFTVPCRRDSSLREPTIRVCSADSSVAGGHYEDVDIDDGVEDQNTRTPSSIEQTKKFIASLWPLVETSSIAPGHGWFNLTGTVYSFSDPHYSIYSPESRKPEDDREWSVLFIPACTNYEECSAALDKYKAEKKKNATDAATELAKKELDELIKHNVWWQERISLEHLQRIERDPALGPGVLYPQYLLRPLQDKNGLIKDESDIRWIPRKHLDNYAARITWNVTIDLAGMETQTKGDTDYTVLNLHGWGTDGRCYFDTILWGRFSPDEVIEKMFWLWKYRPQIMFFKIEKEAHARVLLPFLMKAMAQRGTFLPVLALERDNKASKTHRITGTQPYWQNGAYAFCDDIDAETKSQLILEAKYFPKFNHDDILDTIADALQSRDGAIMPDVEGSPRPELEGSIDYDGQERTYKGIPVANLSLAALNGMQDDDAEYSTIFQPW